MSKRDTDTEIWSEDWFLELSDSEMLFWFYIKDKCDHAGFWRPNFKMFENSTGRRINQKEFLSKMNTGKERIMVLKNGRWFLTGFISFQYCCKLNLNNRFHKSVFDTYRKNIPLDNSTCYGFEVTQTSIRPQVDLNKEQNTKHKKEGGMGETKKKRKSKGKESKVKDFGYTSPKYLWEEKCSSFEKYQEWELSEYEKIINDSEWIRGREEFHPSLDILLSLKKAHVDFWSQKAGWKNIKARKAAEIDWKATWTNALANKLNQVKKTWEQHKPKKYVKTDYTQQDFDRQARLIFNET